MKPPCSFFLNGECEEAYRRLRDEPRCAEWRDHIEYLWQRFQPSSDRNFRTKAQRQLHQCYWEMYLFVALKDRGVPVQLTSGQGPDFRVDVGGRRYWVEAIAPGRGTGPDQVPEECWDGQVREVPREQILLRYTSAIKEKLQKWGEWRAKGHVNEGDGYIFAVNGGGIPSNVGGLWPFFLGAYLPIGPYTVVINSKTLRREDEFFSYSDSVSKLSGETVSTGPLLGDAYAPVSGVLHSNVDAFNYPSEIGRDFDLLHNPKAQVPLLESLFGWCRQWRWEGGQLCTFGGPRDDLDEGGCFGGS